MKLFPEDVNQEIWLFKKYKFESAACFDDRARAHTFSGSSLLGPWSWYHTKFKTTALKIGRRGGVSFSGVGEYFLFLRASEWPLERECFFCHRKKTQ